jgi:hypothetical protein
MKTSRLTALAAAIVSAVISASTTMHASESAPPSVPTGWLTASADVVKAGSHPTLQWNITYPSTVKDYVTVIDPATVDPKETLDMEIRVLGAGVTSSRADGSNLTFVPTEAYLSISGGSYARLFYGTNEDVKPNTVVYSDTVEPGEKLRFGGRYYFNQSWSYFYNSNSGTQNIRTLVNGDIPPTTYPLHTAPTLESFLKPYLDASGRVSIGPMDVIVFMELTHSDSQMNHSGYDLQDMVLLVTFETKKGNGNGNGNGKGKKK